MRTRTHLAYSADPIVPTAAAQRPTPAMKPEGFWYEVNGDWRRWCSDERWGTDARHLHAVDLGDADVLVIDTLAKLDAFNEEYGTTRGWTDCPIPSSATDSANINWSPVATRYDGIEIAPYQWDRRYDYLWYYGWDCASGCIWQPRNASVSYLMELPEDWATVLQDADV